MIGLQNVVISKVDDFSRKVLEADPERYLGLVPREIVEVEPAEASLRLPCHLRGPGNGQGLFSSEIHEESRPDEQGLAG